MESFPKRIILKHPRRAAPPPSQTDSTFPAAYKGMMVVGAACFLPAVISGIWKIAVTRGFALPSVPAWIPPHSHLMVGGFLATLIMFERMIGLRIAGLAWVPYLYAFSAVVLHTGWWPVRALHAVALIGWIAHRWLAYRTFHRMEKPLVESVAYVTLSSALNYPGGLPSRLDVALAALAFPAATIVVERLELSLHRSGKRAWIVLWLLVAWCAMWNVSVWGTGYWFADPPITWLGIFTLAVAFGAVYFDTSLRFSSHSETASAGGMYRYLRVALTIAYLYLVSAAIAMIFWTRIPGAIVKDVLFHSLGLGFIFTMILAHGPLILPSLVGKLPPETPPWIPFLAFQAMTLLRLAGDFSIAGGIVLWAWSGWITGIAHVIAFMLAVLMILKSGRRSAS